MSTSPPANPGGGGETEKIGPGDSRYRAVIDRQFNKRFRGSPDYIRQVGSTEAVLSPRKTLPS